jgi:hypothetical protein
MSKKGPGICIFLKSLAFMKSCAYNCEVPGRCNPMPPYVEIGDGIVFSFEASSGGTIHCESMAFMKCAPE